MGGGAASREQRIDDSIGAQMSVTPLLPAHNNSRRPRSTRNNIMRAPLVRLNNKARMSLFFRNPSTHVAAK